MEDKPVSEDVIECPECKKEARNSNSPLSGVLFAADHHEATGKLREAHSNREYANVINGQMVCHRLVEEALGI